MKKYKLIKEYPGSPKLGTIIEWRVSLGGYWAYKRSDYKSVPNWKSIQLTKPKNHPEYWEEVVEKDFEILAFISPKNTIYTKGKNHDRFDGIWSMYRPTEEDCLKEKDFKIHSVKRLSDGEIFTIGDKTNQGVINNILLVDNNILFNQYVNSFKNIQHVKQPLFTTEDGVDIYEDSNLWSINKKTFQFCSKGHKGFYKGFIPNVDYLYFSTEEKAEEYIDFHKIQYSKQDVFNIIHKGFGKRSASTLGKHEVLAMFDIRPLPSEQQKLFTIKEIEVSLENSFKKYHSKSEITRDILINLLKQ